YNWTLIINVMAITKLDNTTDLSLEAALAAYSGDTKEKGLVRQLPFNKVNTELNLGLDEINSASLESAYSASCSGIKVAEVTLTADEIVGNATGDLNEADGAVLVASAGTGYIHQFLSAVLIYDHVTADYTGGGNDTVIQVGVNGAQVALSAAIASASFLGASADTIVQVNALDAADVALTITGANIISLY
ncbi:unnamed protein product, partial [marine sediment metagenome]